jgi:hypothetical protein
MRNDYKDNNSSGNNDLVLFLKTMNFNSIQFELIRFWGWHPQVKLSFDTLADILNIARPKLKVEVAALIEKDILAEQHINDGNTIYTLSRIYKMQPSFNKFSRLDWSEVLNLKKQLFN